jgi:hypothetical protein
MRYAPRAILAAALGFAVSFVVACGGGSGLLSGDTSSALSGQADQVSQAVQSRNCGAAVNASAVLNSDVQALPATVNATLRSNLSQGASTIAELARKDCHHTASTQSTTTSSSTTTTSTSTSTSTSTTTPPTTTSTSTTSTSATTPTDTGSTSTTTGGVGLGGGTTTGNGNGNGSGGTGPGQGNTSSNGGGG